MRRNQKTSGDTKLFYKDLSYKIVGLAMEVYNSLGYGYLEKVYENALMVLLEENDINAEQQDPIKVHFRGKIVGNFIADILVDDKIILELKSVEKIVDAHFAQVLNYLNTTGKHLAIIINFGKESLETKRVVL